MLDCGYLFLLLHMGLTDHPATRQQCNLHGKGKGKYVHKHIYTYQYDS